MLYINGAYVYKIVYNSIKCNVHVALAKKIEFFKKKSKNKMTKFVRCGFSTASDRHRVLNRQRNTVDKIR